MPLYGCAHLPVVYVPRQRPNLQEETDVSTMWQLESVAILILGYILKMSSGNHYVLVTTWYYKKLTTAIYVTKVASTNIASVFVDHLIMSYELSTHILTGYVPQFGFKFFPAEHGHLGTNIFITTSYYPK